eukprot:scaffold1471_cov413-Prasinococcus_capsulatus_cf.AAC.30
MVLYAWIVLGGGDLAEGLSKLLTVVSRGYLNPNAGGDEIPSSEGKLADLAGDDPLFCVLYDMFINKGGVYRLEFGPKCFIVVSDPIVMRHILKENPFAYDKGVLAEILEPIMGKGLIPADIPTWKQRRRAIQPGFHNAYLEAMAKMFGECALITARKLERVAPGTVNMETEYYSLALDIIGKGIFNFDFNCIEQESPVIEAVYGVLKECEHRSTFYLPYWNLPFADKIVPRQRKFREDMVYINNQLDVLIDNARTSQSVDDIEALQARNYDEVHDKSLLRFLMDMRGEDVDNKQLRDDLMTMMIAGHETTAAVLTWLTYELSQKPEFEARMLQEIDEVMGDSEIPTYEQLQQMTFMKTCIMEALRLYPQPPLLIRRCLEDDVLPTPIGGAEKGYPIVKGTDFFLSIWNLHRSPHIWEDPHTFNPDRFSKSFGVGKYKENWAGYDPDRTQGQYPNESNSDYAFLPFGGGPRKCIGDQFALMEAQAAVAVLWKRFHVRLAGKPEDVGMAFGASIHTLNGLHCALEKRVANAPSEAAVPTGR